MMCDAPVRTPHIHTAPLLPGRDHSRSPSTPEHMCPPPSRLSPWLHTFQIRTGDLRGCTRRGLALLVRAYRERVNGTILELASSRLGVRVSSRAFRTTCARPMSPPPFALTAAQPSPPAPPSRVPRAAQAPVHRMPHPPSPGGTSSPPRARAYPSAALLGPHVPVHTFQVRAGDSRGVRRTSSARSLRARRCRLSGAMHEFDCYRVSSRAAVCCGV